MPTVKELLTQFQRDSSDVVAPADVTTASAPKKKTVKEILAQYSGATIGQAAPEKPDGISKEQFIAENVPLAASGVPGVGTLGAVKLLVNKLADVTKTVTGTADQAQEFLRPIREKDQYGLGPFALAGGVPIGLLSGLIGMIGETPNKLINPELAGENTLGAVGSEVGGMAHSLRGTPLQLAELLRQIPQSMGVPDTVEIPGIGPTSTRDVNLPAIILDKIGELANAPMGNVEQFKQEQIAAQQENPSVGVGNAALLYGGVKGLTSGKTTPPESAYKIPGLGKETPENPIFNGPVTRQAQIESALEKHGGDLPDGFGKPVGGEAIPLGIESAARTFDRNPAWKELVYRPAQELEHQSKLRVKIEETAFNDVAKQNDIGMTNRTAVSNAIGANLISKRAGGAERLALTDEQVRDLSPNEQVIADHMTSVMADHFHKMNKVRTSIGKEPVPPVENYFTFAQAVDEMAQQGVNPVLVDPKAIAARSRVIADEAVMRNLKRAGKEANPVNTDAFGIFRNYIEHAIRYEELTPHIDRVNRMLDGTYGTDATPRPNVTIKGGKRKPDYTLGQKEKLSAPPRRGLPNTLEPTGPSNPLFRRDPSEPIVAQPQSAPSLFSLGDVVEQPRMISPRVSGKRSFTPDTEKPGPPTKGGLRVGKTPKTAATPESAVPLTEKYPNLAAYTKSWLNDISGVKPVRALHPTVERFVARSQRNITRAALSFNVMSTLIQPTALVPAYSELGPRYLGEGISLATTPKWRKLANEKSQTLFGREYETSIADAAKGIRGRVEGVMAGGGELGLKLLKLGDLETARATWIGAYRKGLKDFGFSDANAIKYADDVVVKTQGSASPIDRAPIQRSQVGKAASMFGTYTMNNWGYITRDLLGRGAVKRNTAAQIAAIVNYGVANQLVNTVYGQYSPQPNPIYAINQYQKEHPKDRSNQALLAGMKEFWKVVPIVGGGARFGEVQLGGPIAGLAKDAVRVVNQDPQAKPLSVAGRILGVPGTIQVQKIVDQQKKKKKSKKR